MRKTADLRYVGGDEVLSNAVGDGATLQFQVDGRQVFGAVSTRVTGTADLTPAATAATRLRDLGGATGAGVTPGVVRLSNGGAVATVDLSGADTLGDVADLLTAAGVGVTASVTANGLQLNGAAVSVTDVGGGKTSEALGLTNGGGASVVGDPVRPRVTPLTRLADLRGGAGLDPAGLTITNGLQTQTVDPTALATVEDFLNAINGGPTGARAEINESGTGLNVVNPVQTGALSIAENGGTTAADLGLVASDVKADGLFAHLAGLRDALAANDQNAITAASEGLDADLTRVINSRGAAGARTQEMESRQGVLADQNLASKSVLSELEDADFSATILKYQTLQTSLQATLRSSSQLLNQSLMDFLN